MRIVVKVGTSTLAYATGRLNIRQVEKLCKVLSDLKNAGHEIILVSSGAIGMGVGKLSLSGRPSDMPGKQAAAIVNENDTIATKEIAVGDNDSLGAIVAACCKADLLVVLSDIDGLYTANPKEDPDAEIIPEVAALTPDLYALAGGKGSELAVGGMVTKLHAAEIATTQGVTMIITNGAAPERLYDIVEGKPVGTKFLGR